MFVAGIGLCPKLFRRVTKQVRANFAGGIDMPLYLMMMTPHLATIAVMVWAGAARRVGTSGPGAFGPPHLREERS